VSQPLRVSEILLRELDDNGILHLSLNDAMRRNWLFADTPRGRGRAGSGALGRAGSDHGNPLKQIELVSHRRAESSLEARFRR